MEKGFGLSRVEIDVSMKRLDDGQMRFFSQPADRCGGCSCSHHMWKLDRSSRSQIAATCHLNQL
ncbi:hypothetical protein EXN66_Car010870 [Channa argus]|uniref:Uncharacterized protein n=1 Tax=Channa argus TaxID=215402 RepID=A0A6G1PYI7_CHAAH|nr:hypothetical protein EXN66_Car010870 [Channa argus]